MILIELIDKSVAQYEMQYVKFIKYHEFSDDEVKIKADAEAFRYEAELSKGIIKSEASIYESTIRFAVTVAYENRNQFAKLVVQLCNLWKDYFNGKLIDIDRFDWAVANQPANTIFFDTATKTFELIQFH